MAEAYICSSSLFDWQRTLAVAGTAADSPCARMLASIDDVLARNPESIALREYVGLLEGIGRCCRGSSLAWATGQAVDSPRGSDVGRAILGCRSLGSALHWMCRFFPLLQDASSLRLDVDEDWTTLSYKILDPSIWPRHEDAMYTLGTFARLIKTASPEAWNHVHVMVEAEPDIVKADLATIVQAPVIYGNSANAIRFPTRLINAALNLAQACDTAVIKRLSADLTRKKRAMSISDRTRHIIYSEMNDGCVSQEHIARELGISSRTLRRRLSEDNQSFQLLLDECRMQFAALEFRIRRSLSLSDMALRLGYSEHSTFSRAFSRWAGMAPQEYRRAVSSRPPSAPMAPGGLARG